MPLPFTLKIEDCDLLHFPAIIYECDAHQYHQDYSQNHECNDGARSSNTGGIVAGVFGGGIGGVIAVLLILRCKESNWDIAIFCRCRNNQVENQGQHYSGKFEGSMPPPYMA